MYWNITPLINHRHKAFHSQFSLHVDPPLLPVVGRGHLAAPELRQVQRQGRGRRRGLARGADGGVGRCGRVRRNILLGRHGTHHQKHWLNSLTLSLSVLLFYCVSLCLFLSHPASICEDEQSSSKRLTKPRTQSRNLTQYYDEGTILDAARS